MAEDVDFFEEMDQESVSEGFKNKVTSLVRDLRQIETDIAALDEQKKELVSRKTELETYKIPDALAEAGLKEFVTLEGLKVTTKFVVGTIPADMKERAYAWLDEKGHSSIIKRGVAVKFDKGSEEAAEKAAEQLRSLGLEPTLTLDIHAQTWMSFAREQIDKGTMLPLDQWGVFHGVKAVVK